MKVLVVGSGTMGSGIAQVIAQSNIEVYLNDVSIDLLDKAYQRIGKNLSKLVAKGRITDSDKENILKRIITCVDIKDAKDANLVIEAVVENMKVKQEIFSNLDQVMNEKAILATNTSSLSITEIATSVSRRDKVIGIHFFNPAPIMKLVEVIKSITTSEETLDFVLNFVKQIGKEGVLVEEAPGFVVNRLLVPMINEAVGIYAENIALATDIDKAMMLGANHPMGPLALSDLIGNDVVLAIMDTLFNEFGDSKYRAHPLLRKMVRGNLLGRKSGEGFYQYLKNGNGG
jgi:3-hydroxybutyryl-CoA dehydrogenase